METPFVQIVEELFDFSNILRTTIAASCLILVVVLLRLLVKGMPKWSRVVLWGLVAVRLLMPISIESHLSLLPRERTVVNTPESESQKTPVSAYPEEIPDIVYEEAVTVAPNPSITVSPTVERPQIRVIDWRILWLTGVALMLLYAAVSSIRLRRKVRTAVRLREEIYQCEFVDTPFVLGIFRPKIYLPWNLNPKALPHVVAHESAHIRGKDHLWKPLGFLLLSVHWFNPLMWLAYMLLCRDLELACDQRVIRTLSREQQADYTQALLTCSAGKRVWVTCPLAFGEVGVKERVKSVLHYKKPSVWVTFAGILLCVAAAVCFLTDPVEAKTTLMGAEYTVKEVVVPAKPREEPWDTMTYCVTGDYHLYTRTGEGSPWEHLGDLQPISITEQELEQYLQTKIRLREITDARFLKTEKDHCYLVFRTRNGATWLAHGQMTQAEWGASPEESMELQELLQLESDYSPNHFDTGFMQRSLTNTVGSSVYCFASYQNESIPDYCVVGFKSGQSSSHDEMTDMGFAVFYTDGTGWCLVNYHLYKDAAVAEQGFYICPDPAVADLQGVMQAENTFDVILISSDNVGKIQWHYTGDDEEKNFTDMVRGNAMSLLSREDRADGSTRASVYDIHGGLLSTVQISPETADGFINVSDLRENNLWTEGIPYRMSEFPEVTFYCTHGQIVADNGIAPTILLSGMPILNAYIADLSGDGIPEICTTVCFGSGMVDTHVEVFDYTTMESYTLWERGEYDYNLYMENGQLFCGKWAYPMDLSTEPLELHPLILVDAGGGSGRKLTFAPADVTVPALLWGNSDLMDAYSRYDTPVLLSSMDDETLLRTLQNLGLRIPLELDHITGQSIRPMVESLELEPDRPSGLSWDVSDAFFEELRRVVTLYYSTKQPTP